MKSRLIASLAIGAVVALSATGCSMIAPQATTIQYSVSDGVNVYDSGPLDVRNAMVVATEDGSEGNFIAAVVNDTDSDHTLSFNVDGILYELPVPARERVSLGVDGADPILIERLNVLPGADVDITFQSGDGTAKVQDIPVIDGELPYYAEFVPTPAATP